MTSTIDQAVVAAPVETDLPTLVQRVLATSSEPLTLSKIRSRLPGAFRNMALEELGESLLRQVAAIESPPNQAGFAFLCPESFVDHGKIESCLRPLSFAAVSNRRPGR